MREVSRLIERTVRVEIAKHIARRPGGQKLRQQAPPERWVPNAAFVNCYDGPQQSVGWHTDQLTYLGPHPTIASLSLGVQREFRVRRIVPPPESDPAWEQMSEAEQKRLVEEAGDLQGQIAIPLPHNSLLIMHSTCQEEWKHSVSSARSITPHGVAGGKRVNITYRWYREEFEPRFTPRCHCKVKVKRKPIEPVTVLPFSQIETGFRTMQMGHHIGKIVFEASPDDIVPMIPATIRQMRSRSNKST